jgi:hypothetical protein
VVVQLSTPRLESLEPSDEATAIQLLADLLLEAVRSAAAVPSAGPALIEHEELEG